MKSLAPRLSYSPSILRPHRVRFDPALRTKLIVPHLRPGRAHLSRPQSTTSPAHQAEFTHPSTLTPSTSWHSPLSEPPSEAATTPTSAPAPAPAGPAFVSVTNLPCQLKPTTEPLSALDPATLSVCTSHLRASTLTDLARLWIVFLVSGTGWAVRAAPAAVRALEWTRDRVEVAGLGRGVWNAFEAVMRPTFFSTFVGGESVDACAPKVDAYAARGVGALLNYSAESDHEHDTGAHPGPPILLDHLAESIHALQTLPAFPTTGAPAGVKPAMLSMKLTGLVSDAFVLARASDALAGHVGEPAGLFPSTSLSAQDQAVLNGLHEGMRQIAGEARRQNVRLLIDAEQSWFQPAIDRFADALSQEFNTHAPIVHNTYQAYRRSTPAYLTASIARADAKGYCFGAKLVRGAYMEAERERHADLHLPGECTVWATKAETDTSYDACAKLLAERVAREAVSCPPHSAATPARTSVCFAGHNGSSVRHILTTLAGQGLVRAQPGGPGLFMDERLRGRMQFGQLMGMADNLTDTLTALLHPSLARSPAEGLPWLFKALPYATVEQAVPYLLRRANENQSILQGDPTSGRGGAKEARRAVGKEMRSRAGLGL